MKLTQPGASAEAVVAALEDITRVSGCCSASREKSI